MPSAELDFGKFHKTGLSPKFEKFSKSRLSLRWIFEEGSCTGAWEVQREKVPEIPTTLEPPSIKT